jgi:pimeloyl-ACP methyl ester carboxylesterase
LSATPNPARRQEDPLGLTDPISRRDFVNGVLLTGAGLFLHGKAPTISPEDAFNGYGGIGDYAHSNGNTWEVLSAGHAMRDGAFEKRIANATDTGETYDLVAVGGGISGLAAAVFFQKYKGGRALVIDNHPIFGGEAKRNQFLVDGQRLTAHQGSAIFLVPKKGGYTDQFYEMIGMDRSSFDYQTWRGPLPEMPLSHSPYDTPRNYGFYFGPEFGQRPGVWVMDPWRRQLEGAPIWDTELASFFSALRPPSPVSLGMLHPYRPGKVPVVLIHGTASSPARWADMVNELQNDPKLKDRIDFWLFTYNTSNPILLSASELRTSLRRILSELDPLGRDPALRQVVLIGHSQGGLLARLMVTDSGERFWAATTEVPFEQVKARPETRELIERTIFFQPLPFVSRVVFICTPHQGSFRSSSLVLGLLRRLIRLPATLGSSARDLSTQNEYLGVQVLSDVPNAVENMRPGQRFVKTLSASPIAPGVSVHSIVAVPEAGPPAGQTDGVVAYESAHLEGVGSEKIVRSHHSAQGNPATILEVRRILYEHLGIPCGLECEVVDRVDAAAAAMEKPEPPEVETEWAERP